MDAGVADGQYGCPLPAADSSANVSTHELYVMCDELDVTIRDLQARRVELHSGRRRGAVGRVTRFRLPSGGEIGRYEPRHPRATDLQGRRSYTP